MSRNFSERDLQLARDMYESGDAHAADGLHPIANRVRRHSRKPLMVAVTCESEHNFYTGITRDISEGGLFISCDEPPATGTEVSILIALAGDDVPMMVRGVVRWVRLSFTCGWGVKPGFGVQFTEVSEAALASIARFTTERDTIFFDV